MSRTSVDITTDDGVCPVSLFRPGGRGPWPAVIFYMDGPGIRPVLFEMGQRLADLGYFVLLPDLFYRAGPYQPVEAQALFSDPDKRAAHGRLFNSTGNVRAAADTRAFLAFLDAEPDALADRVGVHGYCMGGGMALTVAGSFPGRVAAAASFHGARLATDADDSPHRLADRIEARILVAGADNDRGFPPEQADELEAALEAAGVDHRVEIWPGALHGWTMQDLPVYNARAAERHWQELAALYADTLGTP